MFLGLLAPAADADEMRTFVKHGIAYEDVKMDLEQAIEGRGLKIGTEGDIGDMLARTSQALKAGPAIYKSAHFIQFCSAVLAHKLAAADPSNIGHCPFLMFVYETVAQPGEVVIGYRQVRRTGGPATTAVLDEVEALYEGIAADALK